MTLSRSLSTRLKVSLAAVLFAGVLSAGLLLASPAFAQDAKVGRLPDGRAYRTDSQGNEIVDYIAELELNIESLQRQVQGLETETQRKQETIDSLRAGKGANPPLAERDLITGATASEPVKPVAKTSPPASCDQYIDLANHYARAIEDQKLDMEVSQTRCTQELRSSRGEVARLTEELRLKNDEQNAALARVASLEQAAQARSETRPVPEPPLVKSAANIPLSPPDTKMSDWPPASSASFEHSRSQAVQALQIKMQRDLNSLEALAASRNTLYQRYTRLASSPEIRLESIDSIRKKIDSYRHGINGATKVHQLSDIRLAINTLRGEIQRDIAIMRRVVR